MQVKSPKYSSVVLQERLHEVAFVKIGAIPCVAQNPLGSVMPLSNLPLHDAVADHRTHLTRPPIVVHMLA